MTPQELKVSLDRLGLKVPESERNDIINALFEVALPKLINDIFSSLGII